MVNDKYYEYAKKHGGVQLAALQAEFKLNYKEAKIIVDTLVSSGYISYEGGLDYKYIKPAPTAEPTRRRIRQYGTPRIRSLREEYKDLDDGTNDKIKDLFKRLRAELEEEDEHEDEDEDDVYYDPDWDFLTVEDAEDEDEEFENLFDFDVKAESDKIRLELNRKSLENLHSVLLKMIEIKSRPVSPFIEPDHSLWQGDNFDCEVFSRIEKLVQSDRKMGLKGAIKKAETYLEAVRDTHDRKMVQLYENIVYRLKSTTSYQFNLVKKYLFDGEE